MEMKSITFPGLVEKYGVAPGGYGYGEVPVDLGSTTDDTVFLEKLNEQFSQTVSKTRKVRFTWGGGAWTGELWNAGNNHGVLTAYSYAVKNVGFVVQKVIRNCVDGTWQDWEYENPPLMNNTEYRTTERYAGKPVYIKRINYGALGAAGTTPSIPLDVDAFVDLVDFSIITKIGNNLWNFPIFDLYNAAPRLTGYFAPSNRAFVLQCHIDLSESNTVVIVKYTKD